MRIITSMVRGLSKCCYVRANGGKITTSTGVVYLWLWAWPRPPASPHGSPPHRWTCPRRWRKPSSLSARSRPCHTWSRTCRQRQNTTWLKLPIRLQMQNITNADKTTLILRTKKDVLQYFSHETLNCLAAAVKSVFLLGEVHRSTTAHSDKWRLQRGGSIIQQWHTVHREVCIQSEPTKLVQYSWDVSLSPSLCVYIYLFKPYPEVCLCERVRGCAFVQLQMCVCNESEHALLATRHSELTESTQHLYYCKATLALISVQIAAVKCLCLCVFAVVHCIQACVDLYEVHGSWQGGGVMLLWFVVPVCNWTGCCPGSV